MKKIITVLPPSRKHDWVSLDQVKKFLPEFRKKVKEVESSVDYSIKTKSLVSSINEALQIHEIISWKQYDTVINCSKMPLLSHTTTRKVAVRRGYINVGLMAVKRHLDELHWDVAFNEEDITISDLL